MSGLLKFIVFCLTFAALPSAQGADSVNLIIMIEDADKNSLRRNNQINKRVYASISQQLSQVADIYDETSLTLDTFNQDREYRTDAELIDIARSITRPPIDLVVVLSTYAAITTTDYAKNARARVAAKILNAKSGLFLDNFEVLSPRTWSIPYACNKQSCILEEIGDEAKVLGDELGLVLAEKLNWLISGETSQPNTTYKTQIVNDYYLEFDGFSLQDMANIEEYLLLFSGYISHRPTQQRHTRTTLLYRSTSGTAKLSRNILKLLEELTMRATINFEGNNFNVKRITFRGENPNRDIAEGW
ncbi:hypothetical protein [Paraglaciecola arctica]|uniref:hypothetical protein n=1 Tax=Paraglaciecola arctica TaxID=1128911 RepID=UPI001C0769C4|nr:hypothetical protein [Paraglaciecola arctica]MBU3003126.1 hypothetical protein [Paraglaciecola arctica]